MPKMTGFRLKRLYSHLRWGAALLIGVVMSQAALGVFRGHAAAFVHPAVVGEMRSAECVVITSCSPIDKMLVSRFDELNFFHREKLRIDCHHPRHLNCWEHRYLPSDFGYYAVVWSRLNHGAGLNDAEANVREAYIVGWREPKILSDKSDALLVDDTKILNVTWGHPDISSQLAFFGIVSNPGLHSREDRRSYSSYGRYGGTSRGGIFEPVLLFLGGIIAYGIGLWRMYFTARTGGLRTWVYGFVLLWLGAVA